MKNDFLTRLTVFYLPSIIMLMLLYIVTKSSVFRIGDCVKGNLYTYKITNIFAGMYEGENLTNPKFPMKEKIITIDNHFKKVECPK